MSQAVYRHSGTLFPGFSFSNLYCAAHKPDTSYEGGVVREVRAEEIPEDAVCHRCHCMLHPLNIDSKRRL